MIIILSFLQLTAAHKFPVSNDFNDIEIFTRTIIYFEKAMYKNKNTETGNGMRGTRGMGVCYIPGNVAKHSGECPQTFWGMSPNIPGNVLKHSQNVAKHSGECRQTFQGMSSNFPGNVAKHSEECPQTFRGMS